MLDEIIKEIIGNKPNYYGLDNVLEKEVIQLDILFVLAENGFLDTLTFMGGTALRLCYGAARLSEDLDFTGGCHFDPKKFEHLDAHLERFLANKYGLNVKAKPPKPSHSDTATWKITLITRAGRPDLPAQKMHIDICAYDSLDTVKRPIGNHYGFTSPITGLRLQVESLNEIMADKIIAFAYRERRIKPRDVWDIAWLTEKGATLDREMLIKKLAMRKKPQDDFIEKITDHAKWLRERDDVKTDFENELTRFLPQQIREKTLSMPDFYPYVCQTMSEVSNTAKTLLKNQKQDKQRWGMGL